MPLWFLWLRRGHIGTLASGLRAFDRRNKPAPRSLRNWPIYVAWVTILVNLLVYVDGERKRQEAENEKKARESVSQPHSDEAGNNPSGDPKKDAASDDEAHEETPASQPAAGNNDDKAPPGKDKD